MSSNLVTGCYVIICVDNVKSSCWVLVSVINVCYHMTRLDVSRPPFPWLDADVRPG